MIRRTLDNSEVKLNEVVMYNTSNYKVIGWLGPNEKGSGDGIGRIYLEDFYNHWIKLKPDILHMFLDNEHSNLV